VAYSHRPDAQGTFGAIARVNLATGEHRQIAPDFAFGSPAGVTLDAAGNIIVVDPFDRSGNQNRLIRVDGGHASVRSDSPGFHFNSVAVEPDGNLLITSDDPGNVHLFRCHPVSGPLEIAVQELHGPAGVAIEPSGGIVMTENRSIIRINPATGAKTQVTQRFGGIALAVRR
jgi:sugar lactone lactonase YvrE